MTRLLFALACLLLLGACATTPYRYYDDRYYAEGEVVVDDGYAGYRSVYPVGRHAGGYYDYPLWVDYPAYHSVFWSFNRWYVDPLWHPHFYYGVTWFPRNYYSVGFRHWHGGHRYWRPGYGYLAYSPYRGAWIDHYYDWYPWYWRNPVVFQRYYGPRYGSTRNEAERMGRYSAQYRGQGLPAGRGGSDRWDSAARNPSAVQARRDALRGADYSSAGGRGRVDPGVSGFRSETPATRRAYEPVRGGAAPAPSRDASSLRGEQRLHSDSAAAPRYGAPSSRGVPVGPRLDEPNRGRAMPDESRYSVTPRREEGIPVPQRQSAPPRVVRDVAPVERGYTRSEVSTGYRAPVRQAPAYDPPSTAAPPTQRYSPPVREAPARYAAPPSEPRYQPQRSAPAPHREPSYAAPPPPARESAPQRETRSRAPDTRRAESRVQRDED